MSAQTAYAKALDSALAQHGDLEGEALAEAKAAAQDQVDNALAQLICDQIGIPLVADDG